MALKRGFPARASQAPCPASLQHHLSADNRKRPQTSPEAPGGKTSPAGDNWCEGTADRAELLGGRGSVPSEPWNGLRAAVGAHAAAPGGPPSLLPNPPGSVPNAISPVTCDPASAQQSPARAHEPPALSADTAPPALTSGPAGQPRTEDRDSGPLALPQPAPASAQPGRTPPKGRSGNPPPAFGMPPCGSPPFPGAAWEEASPAVLSDRVSCPAPSQEAGPPKTPSCLSPPETHIGCVPCRRRSRPRCCGTPAPAPGISAQSRPGLGAWSPGGGRGSG